MEIKPLKPLIATILAPLTFMAGGANVTLVSYNFDDGFQGWSPQSSEYFEWTIKDIVVSFSKIDPSSIASLYTSVPLTDVFRSNSYVVSPEILIEGSATLNFYVGFYSYYDPFSRLILEVSADNFQTAETLWNSKNTTTSRWEWMPVKISLSKYAGKSIKFRFFYTDKTGKGGYMGDFAIDNFIITSDPNPDIPDQDSPGNSDNPGQESEEPDQDGKEDSVEYVFLEESNSQYFTLDGRLIRNPSKGIYLMRRGNKTIKVIL